MTDSLPKIVVLADDLTGAAEMAGIALRYHYSVEIVMEVGANAQAEVVVVAANTRSLTQEKAMERIALFADQWGTGGPFLLYKKIDSVLRGHVLAEMEVLMAKFQCAGALLLPANPSLGRTIHEGRYWVKNRPIHETAFAADPEFAIKSAEVLKMVRGEEKVQVRKVEDSGPLRGINIGEVSQKQDLLQWYSKIDAQTMLAGAGDFFSVILEQQVTPTDVPKNERVLLTDFVTADITQNRLYISGTTFFQSVDAIERSHRQKGNVSYLPATLGMNAPEQEKEIQNWADDILDKMKNNEHVIVAIGSLSEKAIAAGQLADRMAKAIQKVLAQWPVRELLLEGGATAAAVMEVLQLKRFRPVKEYAQGVIRMQSMDEIGLCITLKPGSYQWPTDVWKF